MGEFRQVDTGLFEMPDVEAAGGKPELKWLAVADLVINDIYQRPLLPSNIKAIKNIAQNFSWRKFSTLITAPVEGGKFAILDGQHRVHAAAAIGILNVPCQINTMSMRQQAESFAAINGAVINVTIWNLFRASLAAGEEWAVDAHRLVAEAGCRLMTSNKSGKSKQPGEIFAISLVRRHVETGAGERMKLALRLLRASDHGDLQHYWTHGPLRAWCDCFIERNRLFTAHSFEIVLAAANGIDLAAIEGRVDENLKSRNRHGVPCLSKFEYLRAEIGSAIDKALPVRLAIRGGGGLK